MSPYETINRKGKVEWLVPLSIRVLAHIWVDDGATEKMVEEIACDQISIESYSLDVYYEWDDTEVTAPAIAEYVDKEKNE